MNQQDLIYEYVVRSCEVVCSCCKVSEIQFNVDEFNFIESVINKGWKATHNRLYCPKCASKKLKNN